MSKPTFPDDFNQKSFVSSHDTILQTEIERIYKLIMDQKDNRSCSTINFQISTALTHENRKYLLGEIRKNFPHVKYGAGCEHNFETDTTTTKYHYLTSLITDEDVSRDYREYTIELK